ncbi:MAG TPA: hypothetical protein VHO48_03465 [Anaerolineaceae bacterium]|nr:hypothetical protein [Anaerolineaceae bacterium]
MREWDLTPKDPHALTLACDARVENPDYCNDHIWELRMSGGEPPAIAIETSYGLRARLMRIFLRFSEGGLSRSDPASFDQAPRLRKAAPSYLAVACAPFDHIDALAEYWVPRSQVLAGKISVANQGDTPRSIRLELIAQLTCLGEGHGMAPMQMQVTTVLEGQTEDLAPVLFLNGGPEPGSVSYPSLMLDLELAPGQGRHFTWALASTAELSQSFELARRSTARPWEAEIARVAIQEESAQIEIQTGKSDWDAALAFSQKIAYSLLTGTGSALPYPSFTLTRQPDQGYSPRGDGSDHNLLWNGQTALDAYCLSGLILPGGAKWMRGFVLNFLSTQNDQGQVDWKPGLAGQRGNRLAQPLLASLAWRLYQHDLDANFLGQVYPHLLRFFQSWFSPENDRDADGFPEWAHPFQTGFEDNPIFDRWRPGCQGVEVSLAEDPALGAFLAREAHSLIQIARQTGHEEQAASLTAQLERLRQAVDSSWDAALATYRYRDRETHTSPSGKLLGEWNGSGVFSLHAAFVQAQRLLIHLTIDSDITRQTTLQIFGKSERGRTVEVITPSQIIWNQRRAVITTQNAFQRVDEISIQGLTDADRARLFSVDYTQEDCCLYLPIWGLIPSAERAGQIVAGPLADPERYGNPLGIPLFPGSAGLDSAGKVSPISMLWNGLIGEGLMDYGFRAETAGLLSKLLTTIAEYLRREGSFHSVYAANGGKAPGFPNHLHGLAPVRLFLETLGVRLISPWKVIITDFNPFPEPVTVKYRGQIITRGEKQTRIDFPDGQSTLVSEPGTHLVSLE